MRRIEPEPEACEKKSLGHIISLSYSFFSFFFIQQKKKLFDLTTSLFHFLGFRRRYQLLSLILPTAILMLCASLSSQAVLFFIHLMFVCFFFLCVCRACVLCVCLFSLAPFFYGFNQLFYKRFFPVYCRFFPSSR